MNELAIPNPKNWRTHPQHQKDALKGVLDEIGYADALLVREMAGGQYQLIDGHLRAETTPNQEVPVLILDLDEKEAELLLSTLDPIGALAGANDDLLASLVENIETDNIALKEMFVKIGQQTSLENLDCNDKEIHSIDIPEVFQIIVNCEDEDEQRAVFEQLVSEGRNCKIAML